MALRKDTRGYMLRTGENQRADDRYSFSYVDRLGKRHAIYAKTLVVLSDREKKIQRDIEDVGFGQSCADDSERFI